MSRTAMAKVGGALLVGLVPLMLWGGATEAQSRFGPPGRGPGMPMLPMLLRGVNLTPEQDARVKDIVAAHRSAFRDIGYQLRVAEGAMADKLFGTGPVSADDLNASIQQIAQLREQLLREGLAATIDVRAVLTPDQLAKASQIHERMKQLRSEMRSLWSNPQQ
jgi:Spy/CpxP family protein refolding chaperone